MIDKKIYIIDSKEFSNIFLKKKLRESVCEYVDDFGKISTIQNSTIIFILNDYKDCITIFKYKEYRKNIIIASFERDIIKILKNNTSYLDIIDLKKQTDLGKYIKENFKELK